MQWLRTARPYLVLADVVAVGAALALGLRDEWWASLALLVTVLVTLVALHTHRPRLTMSALDDLPTLALAALVGLVVEQSSMLAVDGAAASSALLPRFLILTAALVLARAGGYAVVRWARRRRWVEHRTLVLGAGEVGRQITRAALDHPECGLRPVGFLDADRVSDERDLPIPLLGSYDRLSHFVLREGISEVVVAFLSDEAQPSSVTRGQDDDLVDIIRQCDRLDVEIFCVPRFHEMRYRSRDMDELWGIPLLRAHRATWRSGMWPLKRIFDVFGSAAALLALAPVMVAVAMAVRFEAGPGVLFRQVRVGLDGRPFTLLKFRSLRLAHPPSAAGAAAVWSINGDSRLGPVGRFIRATSLDELPQLLNILRGDMSLVGPRPERPEFVARFSQHVPRYTARHRAPAGLTGLAQVNGLRGDTSIDERARFDNYYIQNWSLWLDMKILARTVSSVLLRRGS